MVQAKDGRLFLLTNHKEKNILIYDTLGNLLGHWTLGLSGAHGLTLDGDTLWITETRGRVIQTDFDGKVLRELPIRVRLRL